MAENQRRSSRLKQKTPKTYYTYRTRKLTDTSKPKPGTSARTTQSQTEPERPTLESHIESTDEEEHFTSAEEDEVFFEIHPHLSRIDPYLNRHPEIIIPPRLLTRVYRPYVPRLPPPLFRMAMPQLLTPTILLPFDPEKNNAEEWLPNFETVALGSEWKGDKMISFFQLFLGTAAKQWFCEYQKTLAAGAKLDFDVLKKAFVAAFTRKGDKTKASSNLKKKRQAPGESVRSYIYECLRLATQANPTMTEDKKIEAIIRGLSSDLFNQTYMKPFTTVEELKTHLQELEDAHLIYGREPSSNGHIAEIKNLLQEMKSVNAIQPENKGNRSFRNNKPHRFSRTNDGQPICYACKKVGHIAAKCTEGRPYCHFHKRTGHLTKDCRAKNQGNASNNSQVQGNSTNRTQGGASN